MALKGSRALAAAALYLAVALATTTARGVPLTASIAVERAASAGGCPDQAALTRNVERILQRRLETAGVPNDAVLQVAVHFAADHDDYSAEVRSLGAKPGERRLSDHGRSCAALAEAVSVAIALLLDKELERRNAVEAPARASVRPPVAPPAGTEPPARAPSDDAPSALELRALFEGGTATHLSASQAALLSEQVGLRVRRHLVLEAGFNAALPATTDYGVGRVRTTLLFASLRACYTFGERYSLGPCARFGIGRLRGVGLGYASVQADSLPWAAFGAGLVAEGPVWGRVFWGLSSELWLPTRRSTFSVENAGTAWESSALGAAASLRLGFRIW